MISKQRELFWKTLTSLSDRSAESVQRLEAAIDVPLSLCRFRKTSENSLLQLQNNKVSFSSANYYDDPFDTYFSFDRSRLMQCLNLMDLGMAANKDSVIRDAVESMHLPTVEARSLISEAIKESNISPMTPASSVGMVPFDMLRAEIQKKLYSICFCDDPSNEVLWLKYADNHRGFVQIYNGIDYLSLECGEEGICDDCPLRGHAPELYPVFYSDERNDATQYGLATLLMNVAPPEVLDAHPAFKGLIDKALCWGAERISLRKRKCHEWDSEWRIICPFFPDKRPSITMRPNAIGLGLRMPEYERRLVISAAEVAGIESIYEMYINDDDEMAMKPFNASIKS